MLQKEHAGVPGGPSWANCITFGHVKTPDVLSSSRGPGEEGRYPECVWWLSRGCPCAPGCSRGPAHLQPTCAAVAHQLLALCCAAGRLWGGPAEPTAPNPRQLSSGLLLQALLTCHMVICVNQCQNCRCSAAECFRPHVENTSKWHVFVSLVNKQCYVLTYTLYFFPFFFFCSCIGVNWYLIRNTANREHQILVYVASHNKWDLIN